MQRLLSCLNKTFSWSCLSFKSAINQTRIAIHWMSTIKIYWATQDNAIKWINHYPFYSSCQNLLSIYTKWIVIYPIASSADMNYPLQSYCKPLSLRVMTEFVLVTCSSFLLSSCFKKDITSNVSLSEFDICICRMSFSYNKRFALSLSIIKAMVQRV